MPNGKAIPTIIPMLDDDEAVDCGVVSGVVEVLFEAVV